MIGSSPYALHAVIMTKKHENPPFLSCETADRLGVAGGQLVPRDENGVRRVYLDGNLARRRLIGTTQSQCIWDTEMAGFGMRVHPTGRTTWFVRVRHRGKHRRVSLGCTQDVDATLARVRAKRLLAEVALDGLPKRAKAQATPTLTDFVDTNWNDLARSWKPSTRERNQNAWRLELGPAFGSIRVGDLISSDVVKWRDDCAGAREARFNRAVPVLAAILKYAEALRFRRKGSNPCRGMPRFKREAVERYLSPLEYGRLGAALRAAEETRPIEVAIVRLLLFTGARVSEIRDLQWAWVKPPHLALPDSKTGPKIIWLNSHARAILATQPVRESCPFVFPNRRGSGAQSIEQWWLRLRKRCGMPDLRLHDLRHSFASTAIAGNVPLAMIGKLLGHALPETTAKYAHLSDDVIGDAAKRISGSLAAAIGLRP
jgi:integrase